MMDMYKDSGIELKARHNENCHQLILLKNRREQDNQVNVKFVNRMYSNALLRNKNMSIARISALKTSQCGIYICVFPATGIF